MKKPHPRALAELNAMLRPQSTKLYLRILSIVLTRYHTLRGEPPTSLGYLRNRDFKRLYEWADSLSLQKYSDARDTYLANQVATLIKKYPWPKDLLDLKPQERAELTFRKAERKCRLMNRKFALLRGLRDPHADETAELRSFIRGLIGRKPDMRFIFENCNFGQGASVGVHGESTHLGAKLTSSMTVTPCARDYALASLPYNFHLAQRFFPRKGEYVSYDTEALKDNFMSEATLVPNNKISFVPKTAKVHRTIAVEPVLNGYLQKGIDVAMRKKLRSYGIDLSDQEINAKMAYEGSLRDDEESFVTIDLASASDSISSGVVRHLLPPAWFDLLNRVRSPAYELNGENIRYEKFCSMGNGFCFPLETLIFVSLCHVCGCGSPGKDFHVYGDDIIVRKKYAHRVIDRLRYYGFTPNVAKTFIDGPFRESCGSNWYKGKCVNTFTLDFELSDLSALFKFLNLSRRNELYYLLFLDAQALVLKRIPELFRFERPLSGPPDTAIDRMDGVFFPDSTTFTGFWNRRLQREDWFELLLRPCQDKKEYPSWVVMAGALFGYENDRSGNLFALRRKTRTVIRLISGSRAA